MDTKQDNQPSYETVIDILAEMVMEYLAEAGRREKADTEQINPAA